MRSHAKAASAGSISSRQLLLAGALALLAAMVSSVVVVGPANAAGLRLFKETFGSASQPTFVRPMSVAVDQSSGNVLVLDGGANEVQSLKVSATAGQLKLSFGGHTTGWSGEGTLAANSTAVTALTNTTGAISKGEEITGPGIKPSTKVSACVPTDCVGATSITLSQATEASAGGAQSLSAELPFNVSAANLREALERLPSIGVGEGGNNLDVSGGPGDSGGNTPYAITFQGLYAARDMAQIVAQNGAVPLTGGNPSSEAVVTTTTDGVRSGVARFNSDGTPSEFSALGSNVIDARRGPGGKVLSECGSEAASCDETPENGFAPFSSSRVHIAVDDSGTVTDGNIYVAQPSRVDVFAGDGHYLGQLKSFETFAPKNEEQRLTFSEFVSGNQYVLGNLPPSCSASTTAPISYAGLAAGRNNVVNAVAAKCGAGSVAVTGTLPVFTLTFQGPLADVNIDQLTCTKVSGAGSCSLSTIVDGGLGPTPFGAACAVGVDADGQLYVGDRQKNSVYKYTPTAALPVATDTTAVFTGRPSACSVAPGASTSDGFIFVGQENGAISKVNATTGALQYLVAPGSNRTQTVDPTTGHVLAAIGAVGTEYDASGVSSAVAVSTLTADSLIEGIAVDAASGKAYISRSGSSTLDVFDPPVFQPTVVLNAATDVSTTKATLNGSVDAEGDTISACEFEYLSEAEYAANGNSFTGPNMPQSKSCAESLPADSDAHPVSTQVSGLKAETTYRFRLVAENSAGPSTSANKTFTTSPTVTTGEATTIADTTATLNGTVNPVGTPFTACKFEYLSAADYAANEESYSGPATPQVKNCTPAAASIEADFQPHDVSAALTGLAKNTTYHFRLSATNAQGTVVGSDRTFATLGGPQIASQTAFVNRTSATLKARINPSGYPTTYRFEWGTDDSYGNRVPTDVDLFAGSGTTPVEVSAQINGLTEETAYHFRVVATSVSGTTEGEDKRFETLNAAGLPNGRGAELVSPANKRPSGVVGSIPIADEGQLLTQASVSGGAILYPILNGVEDSTVGGFLRELGTRTNSGWQSAQISSPALAPLPERDRESGLGNPGRVLFASPDLSCAIVQTFNPLTEDTPEADVELGVNNLYRWDREDGGYELITSKIPLNPQIGGATYSQVDASDDCERVYFSSPRYVFFEGASGIYEWDEGTLRDAGLLPDGTPAPGAVIGGQADSSLDAGTTSRRNAVSPDGSRLFFSATSNEGPNAGKRAIFMREGAEVTDISQSETAVPSSGARFEAASEDGSHVFFKANYGIAETTSTGPTNGNCGANGNNSVNLETAPCDLYAYEVDSGELTDLSADANPADVNGATVQGTVAVSPEGSHVYFAALGRLVTGKGKTRAENVAALSANVYLSANGELSYVTNLGRIKATGQGGFDNDTSDLTGALYQGGAALMRSSEDWSASTTADGEELLFEASGNVTGYESGGIQVAYLYSAESEEVECISCRPDGLPSVRPPEETGKGLLGELTTLSSPLPRLVYPAARSSSYRPRSISDDGKRIFFTSPDVLATGGVANAENVYEWEEGQVYFLAIARPSGGNGLGAYLDMSPSGDDVFIATSEQLAPQDIDFVSDAYDLKVGGGFEPEVTPIPCDPAKDECQGTVSAPPPASVPSSTTTSSQGNVNSQAKKQKKKAQKKKRKKQRKKQRAKRRQQSRAANSNRGGAK